MYNSSLLLQGNCLKQWNGNFSYSFDVTCLINFKLPLAMRTWGWIRSWLQNKIIRWLIHLVGTDQRFCFRVVVLLKSNGNLTYV